MLYEIDQNSLVKFFLFCRDDNPPEILDPVNGQNVNVSVPQQKGYQVFRIVAQDPDTQSKNELFYFLESEELTLGKNENEISKENRKHDNLFKINSNTGVIFLDESLSENYIFSSWKITVTVKELKQPVCQNCPDHQSQVIFRVHFIKSDFSYGMQNYYPNDNEKTKDSLKLQDSSKAEDQLLDTKKVLSILIPVLCLVLFSFGLITVIVIYKFFFPLNASNKPSNLPSKLQETQLLSNFDIPIRIARDDNFSEDFQAASQLIAGPLGENEENENNNKEMIPINLQNNNCFHLKSPIPEEFIENSKHFEQSIKFPLQTINPLTSIPRRRGSYIFDLNENFVRPVLNFNNFYPKIHS